MPEISTNIEVYCACGTGLCRQTESTQTRNRREPCFIVTPCTDCLAKAEEKGREKGYDEGYEAGLKDAASNSEDNPRNAEERKEE